MWSSNIVVIQAWYISSRVKLTFSGLGLEGSYQWWYKDTDHPELSWHSLAWDWEGVTSDEIKILLVLCLVMGITDSPSIQLHWKIFTILLFISFSKTLLTRIRQLVYIAYIHTQMFISICITLDMCMLTCMLISLWVFKVFKSFFWFS